MNRKVIISTTLLGGVALALGWFLIVKDQQKSPPHDHLILMDYNRNFIFRLYNMKGETIYNWQPRIPGFEPDNIIPDNQGNLYVLSRMNGLYKVDHKHRVHTIKDKIAAHHDVIIKDDSQIFLEFQQRLYQNSLPKGVYLFDRIREYNRAGQMTWEWKMEDHIEQLLIQHPSMRKIIADQPREIPHIGHANSIIEIPQTSYANDKRFKPGNLLVNFFYLNLMIIIDPISHEIVWSWGPEQMLGAHTASFLKDGNILFFENAAERGFSKIRILNPMKSEIIWEYGEAFGERFYSHSRGSVQSTQQDTFVVYSSWEGRVFEITRDKKKLWEFVDKNLENLKQNKAFLDHAKKMRAKNPTVPLFHIYDSFKPLVNFVGHRAYKIEPGLFAPISKKPN